jgi:branched-chain amino acid aminotransferase
MAKKLQRPDFAYMNGKLVPWEDAVLHVGTEAVTRGVNVFEGLKGYWQNEDRFGIVFLEQHYKRLLRSAKLLNIPCPWTLQQYEQAIFELMGTLLQKDRDMWIRTTLYVVEGSWGENTKADLVMCAYHQDKTQPEPIDIGVSTWVRANDVMLPARIKTSANYQVGRLARTEGRPRGMEEMVLLNQAGRVAECTGSCILMVRDGVIYTPPASEGALESITLDYTEALAKSLGIPFVSRPIDRTELLIADEIAICGTLAELVPVKRMDDNELDPYGPVLSKIREKFFRTVRGEESFSELKMTFVPKVMMKNINNTMVEMSK